MPPPDPSPGDLPWVKILESTEDYAYGRLFRIIRARLQHRRFDGRMSEPITRINFERGDAAGVLLYDPDQDAVVLVRQFRYPVYAGLTPEQQGDGAQRAWILEIVAGVRDGDETLQEVANRELLEEAGYRPRGELEHIATVYPSPGGSSERIALFLGLVDHREQAGPGGGAPGEGEDIQVAVVPLQEAMDLVERGEIDDAKTIIALQSLYLRQLRRLHGRTGQ